MRVTQVIATLAPIGLVAAGPLHGHSRHTHLHHLHHRSLTNGTLANSTTTDTANSTIYADHISYETSTVNNAANFADGTDANSASSEVASSTISESSSIDSSTTAQSETAFPTLSLTSDGSYASGSPSNSSLSLNNSTAIPSDASVSVVLAVAATTPTAVGALSQTVDTTTSISVDTVYNTVTVNGAVTTASASEKTVTVTDVVTNFVTATFSALTPFKAPAIKVAALSSGSSCAAIKTSIVYLPASQSPTLIAGGASASKVSSSSSSKATSHSTVRYVSQSSSKSSSSSVKKSSTSSKKTSTSAKLSATVKIVSTSTKKSSTSSKKTSSPSAKKVSSTSSKKVTSSSTKKASTSSVKPTSSSKKSSTLITMSSLVQHGATTKTIVTTSSTPALVSGSSYKASSSAMSSSKAASSAQSSSKAAASSSAKASSSSCATVAPPASTQTGIVSGCTKWYTAKSGDYCYVIAAANGISTDTFMAWNPAVNAPSCNNIWVGYAYCVATGCSSGSNTPSSAAKSSVAATSPAASTATTATQTSGSGSSASSTSVPSTAYKMYTGNGTVAAGWPAQSQWMDFDSMFTANIPIMQQSCANNGWGANDSPTEIADINSAIQKVSASSGVDPRFILAIVMQESNGCVRVITTSWSVQNPGLMQDHAGSGTCNSGGVIQDPCPASEIEQMITDGTEGTASGDGLVQCLKEAAVTDVSKYYRAARIYNGGLGGYHANDLGTGCCTLCYASDVANRLTGWSSGPSACTL